MATPVYDAGNLPQLVAENIVRTANTVTTLDPDITTEYLGPLITEIQPQTQTLGAALLNVDVIDPTWKVYRSGLCTRDPDGLLPQVDVEYPPGTDVWWRLAYAQITNDLTSANLTLTFQHRIVSYATQDWGPLSWANLGGQGTTRAQFIKRLFDRIPTKLPKGVVGPGNSSVIFMSPELNIVQPIADSSSAGTFVLTTTGAQTAAQTAAAQKAAGITLSSKVTIKGQPITATQVSVINALLQVGTQLNAPTPALEAIIYAAMGETSCGADSSTYTPNGAATSYSPQGFWGVLQGAVSYWPNPHDIAGQATAFFTGKGPQGQTDFETGAINWVKQGITNPAEIAVRTEVPSIWPDDAYAKEWSGGQAQGLAEATAIVQAAGAAGGIISTTSLSDIADLTRGTADVPDEDTWTCAQRLASEVNWLIFTSPYEGGRWGNFVYYIDGPTLVAQQPSLYLELNAAGTEWTLSNGQGGHATVQTDGGVMNLTGSVDNALALNTPIPTPTGWTTMGDLSPGDTVFDSDGKPIHVLGVSEVQHGHDCYRVRFNDGSTIVADAGHLWETDRYLTARDRSTLGGKKTYGNIGIRTTAEIADTVHATDGQSYSHRVKLTDPLELPDRDLPIDPYIFGYWLGDGSKNGPHITVSDDDRAHLIAELERAGYSHVSRGESTTGFSRGQNWRVHFSLQAEYRRSKCNEDNLTRRLRDLGVFGNKHIPPAYLRASLEQRLALLQGLMDSDGSTGKYCCLALADYRLAAGALELLRGLGFRPGWSEKAPRGYSKRVQFLLNFATRPHLNAFRLPRKAARYAERQVSKRGSGSAHARAIIAVEPVPSVPVRCIAVDADDHLYLAGRAMVPTHNTAFQYFETRKVKGRVQRKTTIRMPQTPSQVKFNCFAGVLEFNAGQVAVFQNTGGLDGRWILEDATHNSLTDLYVQLTLGPPTYPYPEPQATTSSSTSSAVSVAAGSVSGYVNPLSKLTDLQPERIDQGVDYAGSGPLLALGDGKITYATNSDGGWPGGGAVVLLLADGVYAGKSVYYCENLTVSVSVGQIVKAGDTLATLHDASPNLEIGWASGTGSQPLAQVLQQNGQQTGQSSDPGGVQSACGVNFNELLKALGAPSGGPGSGPKSTGPGMPAGWPTLTGSNAITTPGAAAQSTVPNAPASVQAGVSSTQSSVQSAVNTGITATLGGIFGSVFDRAGGSTGPVTVPTK